MTATHFAARRMRKYSTCRNWQALLVLRSGFLDQGVGGWIVIPGLCWYRYWNGSSADTEGDKNVKIPEKEPCP